jgi:phosphohistidine phosphatase
MQRPDFQTTGHDLDSQPDKIESSPMRRLMLLRHAKSDWSSPGQPDLNRPLNERGAEAARLVGSYLARHRLVPDCILCSPATRTRETLAGIAAQWPEEVPTAFDDRLYAAAPQTILTVIRDQKAKARNLMVIAHNPGLHETAELLIAAGDVALRERLREKFPTAALAVIDFAVDAWSRIRGRSGRLDRYVTPRSIAAATN